MAVALALALASALGADLRADAGIRVEAASRTNDARGLDPVTMAGASAFPWVAADLRGPAGTLRAEYAPILRSADVMTTAEPGVLHVAGLEATLRLAPTWSLGVILRGQKGTTDLVFDGVQIGAAPAPEPTPPRAIPTTDRIRYASATAAARLVVSPGPRSAVTLGAGAFVGGGDDGPSRDLMPFERGLRMNVSFDWSATRRDVVGVQATAASAWYTLGTEAGTAAATAGWRRRVTPAFEARVRAGVTATFDDAVPRGAPGSLGPAGEVGFTHVSERFHVTEEAVVRVTSALDRVLGTADRAWDAEASVRWTPAPAWSFVGRSVGSVVFQEAGETRRGTFELRIERGLHRNATVGTGVYGLWQQTAQPTLPSFAEAGAFVSLAYDLRGRR